MAGAGWHDFVPGQVLSAAMVQDYLQDQAVMSFASAAARTSAIASPTDGMVSYLKDSDMVEIYNGSAWTRYGGGFVPVSPSSVAVAGGTASANALGVVQFTGATTSLSINGVFTSAHENYRVVFRADTASTVGSATWVRLRAGAADDVGTNYGRNGYFQQGTSAVTAFGAITADKLELAYNEDNSNVLILDVFRPQLTTRTVGTFQSRGYSAAPLVSNGAFINYSVNAYDGISFIASAGTFTGKLQVFGYND